ncbi:MAG: ABC transporter substrate-binding protein [Burkholderiaceae bacterium]
MQRRTFALAALAASTPLSARAQAPAATKALADNLILLGQTAAISGPEADSGRQYHQGAQLHFAALNARGGISGRRIELRLLDDAGDPGQAAANARSLINDGVFALFGSYGAGPSLAALPLAVQAKVPLVAPLSGAQALRQPYSRFVVHVRASYEDEVLALVRHAAGTGVTKLAALCEEGEFGDEGLKVVQAALSAAKLPPPILGKVNAQSVNVGQAITDIVGKQPHGIVLLCSFKASAAFIRGARSAGYKGSYYALSHVGTQGLGKEMGPLARGIVVSEVMPYPFRAHSALSRDYLEALKTASNKEPSYLGMEGFVAAQVCGEVLRRAGRNLTTDSFLAALDGIRKLNLGSFLLDYGPRNNSGSKFVDLVLLDAKGQVMR